MSRAQRTTKLTDETLNIDPIERWPTVLARNRPCLNQVTEQGILGLGSALGEVELIACYTEDIRMFSRSRPAPQAGA